MKVNLREDGCLLVYGETSVESFALKAWFDMWRAKQSTFQVRTFEVKDDKMGPTIQTVVPDNIDR